MVKWIDSAASNIAIMLIAMLLGLVFSNALSRSHETTQHQQHDDGSYHADASEDDHHGHDHASDNGSEAVAFESGHTHEHDPTDHTHDIPLAMHLKVLLPTFLPHWEPDAIATLHSVATFPHERPPKLPLTC